MKVNKITEGIWEIPKTEKEGMLVPARIFATEKLLNEMDQGVFEQVTNVACLPGIQKYALCMPDGHWGYGFPIGGVAAMDPETGVISPGGIGFDINCLSGDARVLHEFGYHKRIAEFDGRWMNDRIKCVNPHTEVRNTEILAFMKESRPRARVFKVTTESGREIVATEDHPFLTPDGMIPLKDLKPGQAVSVYPFEGVPYEEPSDEVLVTEEDLRKAYPGHANGFSQIVEVLKERGFLPLRMNHPKLPYLIRLMGFIQGDGNLQLLKNRGGPIAFYANPEDLESIRHDVARIGFKASRIYRRTRNHAIPTKYGLVKFIRTESWVHSRSAALALLLHSLGAPAGNKAGQPFEVPAWLMGSPLWMKRLYLAALFGAKLTTPKTVTDHKYNFYCPVLSLNKKEPSVESGRRFLTQIQNLLQEFGVRSSILKDRDGYVNSKGERSIRLRLRISADPPNLLRLWSTIGFEYNKEKQFYGNLAAQYVKVKTQVIQRRSGGAQDQPKDWRKRPRVPLSFEGFEEFVASRTQRLGKTGQVWDPIIYKEAIPFDGPVYDFTVKDPHHNFMANSFVVSNCGMRLIRTNLTLEDVQPRLRELVELLFRAVPCGVGSRGFLRISESEFRDVMREGAAWCVRKGYGWREDLEHLEEWGCIKGADPEKVSRKALERGINQLGTLGSGNHYLEIQVAYPENIHDPKLAQAFGFVYENQIAVMFHCGSRGFGHQIGTDYLQIFERAMPRYGITVRDRELACAPFTSPEGQDYYKAMAAAANSAFANRQIITHRIREVFSQVFRRDPHDLDLQIIYDVAHNIAKVERFKVNGDEKELLIHRKGSTRAFGPGHPELAPIYREIGQPVIVGGSMETGSYLLVGTQKAMEESFGSTCHGSGRTMSRAAAKKKIHGREVVKKMEERGIFIRAASWEGVAEEAGFAYKDLSDVVRAVELVGISKPVVELKPIGNIKG